MPVTPSEELVASLCQRSFLTLWSEANPRGRSAKELCDVLVVCGDDIVLFSVKDIALKDTGNITLDWERWRRKAIDDSVKQLYGAERALSTLSRITRSDGTPGMALPAVANRRIHRVAVALGGRGAVPYLHGEFGKGFVHVLDDVALPLVLGELDTISDFLHYLNTKEALLANGVATLMEGQEEDLLAFYIHQGRDFPEGHDMMVIGNDLWDALIKKPEWKARKDADRQSYLWDGLIETLQSLNDQDALPPTDALDTLESALRAMARETRFCRRMLAQGFDEFMKAAAAVKIRSRIMPSLSDTRYVFLATPRDANREDRRRELVLRCFVARGMMECGDTVVGVATERYEKGQGFSLDAVRLIKPTWTPRDQDAMKGIQRDLGYFATPLNSRATGDEFPLNIDGDDK